MAQLYPSLFSFHLLGAPLGRLAKKQVATPRNNEPQEHNLLPALLTQYPFHSDLPGNPLFLAQKKLLNLIEELALFTPCSQTLNHILSYAADRQKSSAAEGAKDKDNKNYDPQAAISVCN